MSKPYNDFTLIFQGPLHKNFMYGLLNNYKDYTDNIVISHWDTDDSELLGYIEQEGIKCKVVTNKMHKNYNWFNNANVYYQSYTTLEGLKHVNTEYVIKLRTDNWVGNLVPMFDAIRKNPNKYVCSNFNFRPDKVSKYLVSDIIFGGKTSDLLKTFEIVIHRVKNNVQPILAGAYMFTDDRNIISEANLDKYMEQYTYYDVNRQLVTKFPDKPKIGTIQLFGAGWIGLAAETIIGTSYLFAKGIFPSPEDSIRLVNENFDIVRVEDMTPFVNKFGSSQIEHNNDEIHYISQYGQ